jgi:HK97 family phage prohead protease
MEVKNLALSASEIKMGAEGSLRFEGYASVFGGLDSYGDTIKAGAYKNTLLDRQRPVQLRWNHNGPVVGKYTEMYEDEKGLYVKGELTKGHSEAENVAALLRHGAISGLSIGYVVKDSEQDGVTRILKEIDLMEISVVETPADNSAHISSVKSATKLKDVEDILRQKGFSQKEATEIVTAVKKIDGERQELKKEAEENINFIKQYLKGGK